MLEKQRLDNSYDKFTIDENMRQLKLKKQGEQFLQQQIAQLENNRVFAKEDSQMTKALELSNLKIQIKNADDREDKDKKERMEVRRRIQAMHLLKQKQQAPDFQLQFSPD